MRRELNVASIARALFAPVILGWLTPSIARVSVTTYHNDLAPRGLIPEIGITGTPVIDPSTGRCI